MHIVVNAVIKRRVKSFFDDNSFISLSDIVITMVLRYYSIFEFRFQIDLTIYYTMLLLTVWFFGLIFQFKYGSRFFLPNKCRSKRFEYRRILWNDFDLTRMEVSMWPEWDLWMQKLNESSLVSNERSLYEIEGKDWYGKYMRSNWGKNLHYFWLEWLIRNPKNNVFYLYGIDEYDD